MDNKSNTSEPFIDRVFEETSDGKYDRYGFYRLADNSCWDPDGVYFNKFGFDKHGGSYNENFEYQPGKGWIPDLMCYEDEVDKHMGSTDDLADDYVPGVDDYEDDYYNEQDDLYDNIDDHFYDVPKKTNKSGSNQINNSQNNKQFNNNSIYQQYNPESENSYDDKKKARSCFYDYQNEQNPNKYLVNSNTTQSNQLLQTQQPQVTKTKQQEMEEFEKEYPNLNLKTNIPTNPNINVYNKIPENLTHKTKTNLQNKPLEDDKQAKRQETIIEVDYLFK